jgi:thioredoxin-related protein
MRINRFFLKISIINLLFVIALLTKTIAAEVDSGGVNFRPLTLEQAISTAKAEKKKGVFVHCFAEWCHYCMYMKDSVYPDKEVGDLLNKDFVSIRVDLEKEGKALNEVLGIHTFPGLIFYDLNGEIMHRAAGRRYKQPFIDLVNEALDTTKQMRTFKRNYESGNATPVQIMSYFRMMEMAGMNAQLEINKYLMKQSDSDFVSFNSWRIMYDIIKDPTMPAVNRMLDMRKELDKRYTADSVDNKMIILHNYYLGQFIQQLDSAGYERASKKISENKKLGPLAEKICAYADLNKHKLKFEYDQYRIKGPKFVEKYALEDPRRVTDVCGQLYERFGGDSILMGKCEKWLVHSVQLKDYYKANHVLASVYTVQGKLDLAIKTAEHAIELGKKMPNADYKQTTALLTRLNEMKAAEKK